MLKAWQRSIRTPLTAWLLAAGAAASVGCGSVGSLGNPTTPGVGQTVELTQRGPGGTTRFLARNVVYRLDPKITMVLEDMNADVLLKDPKLPYVPANKLDYALSIHHAIVHKDAASLEALMNTYVFNDKDSPLRNLKLAFKDDRLVMSGQMNKGVWVGFEMEGVMSATPEGKILMTPKVVKSMGMRVDGLMNLFGLEMAEMLKTKAEKGVTIVGNNILMDPSKLYPPPTLMGKVADVDVRDNRLHIVFDDGQAKPWPASLPVNSAKSTLLMWGGDVLINATLNLNAKIQMLDATPNDPMVFALDLYREQLEAGFIVATKDGCLITYVPDVRSFTPGLGRFAPPSFPIPGMRSYPTDLTPGSDQASGSANETQTPNSRR